MEEKEEGRRNAEGEEGDDEEREKDKRYEEFFKNIGGRESTRI